MDDGQTKSYVGDDDPNDLFRQAMKTDQRLGRLWKKAEMAGFSRKPH